MMYVCDVKNIPKLSDLLSEVKELEKKSSSFKKVNIFVLRTLTIEPIVPFLKWVFLKNNLIPDIYIEDFGVVESSFYNSKTSDLIEKADVVLFFPFLDFIDLNSQRPGWTNEILKDRLRQIYSLLNKKKNGITLSFNFLNSIVDVLGGLSTTTNYSKSEQIRQLNVFQAQLVQENPGQSFLIDLNQILIQLGVSNSLDMRGLYMNKAPFKNEFLIHMSFSILKKVLALKGNSKKALILDCDNTLWGGVIGEDGIKGIKLDKDLYPGNVFYRFQQEIVDLNQKGVILALCSKNNEKDVFDVLDGHPDILIKRNHLSYWKVNWQDKASNIKEIAEFLNIGLDSFVFVDDNPIEIELVKNQIPQVACVQVPSNIYDLPGILSKNGYFDTLTITEEDRKKTLMYQQEANRKSVTHKLSTEDKHEFLKSLELVCIIHNVTDAEVPRVSQLSQKTNQFNFNTIRMSEAEVISRSISSDYAVFTCQVSDRFGDSGLTGVIILKNTDSYIEVENFYMSCRVLGRSVEAIFMKKTLSKMFDVWGVKPIHATFTKTNKNVLVENYWEDLKIKPIESSSEFKKYQFKFNEIDFPLENYIKIIE